MNASYLAPHAAAAALAPTVGAAPALRIVLAHACPIVRAGLASLLSGQDGFLVSDDPAWQHCHGAACIVITDYASAMQAASAHPAPRTGQAPRLMVLTTRCKEGEVRQAVDAGVHGYVLQGCPVEELVQGVRRLAGGHFFLCTTAVRSLSDSFRRAELTPREADVLAVLAKGSADKLIARELGIGVGTVKHHLKRLLAKLDATTRTHAVVVAMERGLLRGDGGSDGASAGASAAAHLLAGAAFNLRICGATHADGRRAHADHAMQRTLADVPTVEGHHAYHRESCRPAAAHL